MAFNNDLPIKYSNLMYATKQEVQKDMKVPVVDNIWNKILEYRSNFQFYLPLRHITGSKYGVCLTPMINEKVCNVERKMMRAMVNFSKLSNASKRRIKNESYFSILKTIAQKYKINVEDDVLENIATGNTSLIAPNMMVLDHYVNALNEIATNYEQDVDDNFLGRVYTAILGNDELTEFYRTNDEGLSYSKTIINKVYLGLPNETISEAMDELINFLRNSNTSVLVKAAAALYFAYYVKPFEIFNEEIAILLFKDVLAHNDIEEIAAFMNFENLLLDESELEKVIVESQQDLDLTYILNYVIKYTENYLDNFLNRILDLKRNDVETDLDSDKESSFINDSNNSSKETNENESITSNALNATLNYSEEIAFKGTPAGLTEDEAKKLEIHLMELYPQLRRGQAYFYSRHCTLGMTYTIAQYQRANSCSYETARTSMDKLVYFGFYKKEHQKNKFIYTPIKRS